MPSVLVLIGCSLPQGTSPLKTHTSCHLHTTHQSRYCTTVKIWKQDNVSPFLSPSTAVSSALNQGGSGARGGDNVLKGGRLPAADVRAMRVERGGSRGSPRQHWTLAGAQSLAVIVSRAATWRWAAAGASRRTAGRCRRVRRHPGVAGR